ncbi:MAG: NlpC/P60 family N-terminal domain-containing protein [Helicobacter sp.]|nr:NlpC/P60 family N-terminal domain-containing protein [Helicobacter sp.]MDY5740720.1 NlpC/P60 family N-terminal domain-containing protein [Helicobacter sp.]
MLKISQAFSLCALILWLSACTKPIMQVSPKDLDIYAQNANYYLNESLQSLPAQSPQDLEKIKSHYLQKFFAPWNESPNMDLHSVFWMRDFMLKSRGWGENAKPYSLQETQELLDSMRLESYPSANQKGIITKTTNVRAVPTLMPKFSKKTGYPFDRWQNSLIFAGTPVLITHFDTSLRFAHIQAGFVYGWVEVSDIGLVSEADSVKIQGFKNYVTPNADKVVVKDSAGNFYTRARIGQIFALNKQYESKDEYEIFIFKRTDSGHTKIAKARIQKQDFTPFPMPLDSHMVADFITQVVGDKYGWGGMYEERDCSALVRDIFAHNGIFLPRNSKAQALYADNYQDLSKLSAKQKERFILENATPFYTLLWLQGHIMIYLGSIGDRVIVAHSAWSVRSGKKYDNLLGGVVITSLYVGDERNSYFKKSKTLLEKIGSMSDMSVLAQRIQNGELRDKK